MTHYLPVVDNGKNLMAKNFVETEDIVAAVDDSLSARAAAAAAIQIAASLNQPIRGVYIVDESLLFSPYANYQSELGTAVPDTISDDLAASFQDQGEIALQWLTDACQKAGVPVSSQILIDDPAEWVRQNIHQDTLLAVGRRGQGHRDDANHLGSHFRNIARHIHAPMLVGGDGQGPIKSLLLAYNGSVRAQQALAWAALLQQALPAQLMVLFVHEKKTTDQTAQWQREVQTYLAAKAELSYQVVRRQGQPAAEIAAAVNELGVDMVLMGGYQHRIPLVEWLAGSVLDRVLRATAVPVFVA